MGAPRVLWRFVENATLDTLNDRSRGQYHIALARPPGIEDFFAGLPQTPKTFRGYSLDVPLEAAPGPPGVPATRLPVIFNGWDARRREWRIPSQRSNNAYPLWRPGVGPLSTTVAGTDVILLVRDTNDLFHARWLRGAQLAQLPAGLRQAIELQETGTRVLTAAEFAALQSATAIPTTQPAPPPAGAPRPQPPTKIGAPYQPVAPPPAAPHPPVPFTVDPDVVDRGTRAHIETQNELAARVQAAGHAPRRPDKSTPPWDLAWDQDGVLFVVEIKSITPINEERQLRLGLGQLLRYVHVLRSTGFEPIQPVLVAEREPADKSWLDTCSEVGVVLSWPDKFEESLGV